MKRSDFSVRTAAARTAAARTTKPSKLLDERLLFQEIALLTLRYRMSAPFVFIQGSGTPQTEVKEKDSKKHSSRRWTESEMKQLLERRIALESWNETYKVNATMNIYNQDTSLILRRLSQIELVRLFI